MREPLETTPADEENVLRLVIRNDLAAVGIANDALEKFLLRQGIDPEVVFTSALALEEILTNIIKYGYDDDRVHEISTEARLLREELILQVVDDGHEFDPARAPPPSFDGPLEERPIGGLGIHLVVNLVQRLTYARVYSGVLKSGSHIQNSTKDRKERVGRVLQMHANHREDLEAAYTGDIVALVGLKHTTTGDRRR